ncbi:MAG TPA: subtilase [Bdellovibrionales bacterium]|nr:subtilase [Bdellovibrionales bacterium]HCM40519.1 subtilase [Bdellovibrionales bacterium]
MMGISNFSKNVSALIVLFLIGVPANAALQISRSGAHVPGQVIVKLRDVAPGKRIQAHAISVLQNAAGEDAVVDFVPLEMAPSVFKVSLASDSLLDAAIRALRLDPSVAAAEPNIIFHTFEDQTPGQTPNDPDFGKLWGMKNTGQPDATGQVGRAGADINVLPLWNQGFTGNRKVLVGVIDTGVDWTHPDLIENIYTNPGEAGELSANGIDDDGNGLIDDVHGWDFESKSKNSNDDNGHGSHVAGTIGASGNNGVGVAGVNWQVSILPIKFLDAQGSGSLQGAIDAIEYAKKMKVSIINASWGGNQFSQLLSDSVKSTGDAGIIFVAAAGNDSSDNDTAGSYPAGFGHPNIIAVAATDNQDNIAKFSNFGRKTVHVAAPGVKILSTTKNGAYAVLSGTSMASPHVAGVAALLLSLRPEWDYATLKERLIRTSDPMPSLSRKVLSKGRVNVMNALNDVVPPSNEPDESLWRDVANVIESDHPYLERQNQTFAISVPGAKFIRVHFERIDMEKGFDSVRLETSTGVVVEKLTGKFSDYMTDYVIGDSAVIRLTSDLSVQGYGFKVDRIQVIE